MWSSHHEGGHGHHQDMMEEEEEQMVLAPRHFLVHSMDDAGHDTEEEREQLSDRRGLTVDDDVDDDDDDDVDGMDAELQLRLIYDSARDGMGGGVGAMGGMMGAGMGAMAMSGDAHVRTHPRLAPRPRSAEDLLWAELGAQEEEDVQASEPQEEEEPEMMMNHTDHVHTQPALHMHMHNTPFHRVTSLHTGQHKRLREEAEEEAGAEATQLSGAPRDLFAAMPDGNTEMPWEKRARTQLHPADGMASAPAPLTLAQVEDKEGLAQIRHGGQVDPSSSSSSSSSGSGSSTDGHELVGTATGTSGGDGAGEASGGPGKSKSSSKAKGSRKRTSTPSKKKEGKSKGSGKGKKASTPSKGRSGSRASGGRVHTTPEKALSGERRAELERFKATVHALDRGTLVFDSVLHMVKHVMMEEAKGGRCTYEDLYDYAGNRTWIFRKGVLRKLGAASNWRSSVRSCIYSHEFWKKEPITQDDVSRMQLVLVKRSTVPRINTLGDLLDAGRIDFVLSSDGTAALSYDAQVVYTDRRWRSGSRPGSSLSQSSEGGGGGGGGGSSTPETSPVTPRSALMARNMTSTPVSMRDSIPRPGFISPVSESVNRGGSALGTPTPPPNGARSNSRSASRGSMGGVGMATTSGGNVNTARTLASPRPSTFSNSKPMDVVKPTAKKMGDSAMVVQGRGQEAQDEEQLLERSLVEDNTDVVLHVVEQAETVGEAHRSSNSSNSSNMASTSGMARVRMSSSDSTSSVARTGGSFQPPQKHRKEQAQPNAGRARDEGKAIDEGKAGDESKDSMDTEPVNNSNSINSTTTTNNNTNNTSSSSSGGNTTTTTSSTSSSTTSTTPSSITTRIVLRIGGASGDGVAQERLVIEKEAEIPEGTLKQPPAKRKRKPAARRQRRSKSKSKDDDAWGSDDGDLDDDEGGMLMDSEEDIKFGEAWLTADSRLARIDLSDVVNYDVYSRLSAKEQAMLRKLMPSVDNGDEEEVRRMFENSMQLKEAQANFQQDVADNKHNPGMREVLMIQRNAARRREEGQHRERRLRLAKKLGKEIKEDEDARQTRSRRGMKAQLDKLII